MKQISISFFVIISLVFIFAPFLLQATTYGSDTNMTVVRLGTLGIWSLLVLLPLVIGVIKLNKNIRKREIQENRKNHSSRLIRLAIILAGIVSALVAYNAIFGPGGDLVNVGQAIVIFYIFALALGVIGMAIGKIINRLNEKNNPK